MTLTADWDFANRYVDYIRCVVGPCLLGPATLEQDRSEATDLLILKARDMRIACRVRRLARKAAYAGEFTLRSSRDSGAETELAKVLKGFGDWFFYGWESERPGIADPWALINLEVFRREYVRRPDLHDRDEIPNGDGTWFKAFKFSDFAKVPGFLIWNSAMLRQRIAAFKGEQHANTDRAGAAVAGHDTTRGAVATRIVQSPILDAIDARTGGRTAGGDRETRTRGR